MRTSDAFTVLELVIVLAVVGILGTVGFVLMDASRFATTQAANGLVNSVRRVRFEAIKENRTAYMTVNGSGYAIWVDRSNSGYPPDAGETVADVQFGEGSLQGVFIESSNVSTVAFDRRGIPLVGETTPGTIVVSSTRSDFSRTIDISAIGTAEVQ